MTSDALMEHCTDAWLSEDALMKANDDVTEAMRRTLALMQGELERSVLSAQMLGTFARVLIEL